MFGMERKLQAIRSKVGFELVGFLVGHLLGARVGGAVIGTGVVGAAVGLGVLGAAVVGTVVGDVKEELLLAADGCRITSTTSTTTAPEDTQAIKARPKKIHRRWYHFILTYSASATMIVPSSCLSGTHWASTIYKPLSVATRVLSCALVCPPAEFGKPSSCLDSSFVICILVVSWEIIGDLNVRLMAVSRVDRIGNAPGATS